MTTNIKACTTLANGVQMPWLGLGVYRAEEGQEVEKAVATALEVGYRSIDTAAVYGNEEGVGRAIHASGIDRNDIFVTTKVWNSDQGYDTTLQAFEKSKARLGVDYVDLYLIHWPVANKFIDTWKALEHLYREKQVRAIGVSNFQTHHLDQLLETAEIKPMLNQVEFHPYLTQQPLRDYCREAEIQLEAWRPLTHGEIFEHPTLQQLSKKYGKTAAQILLRWNLEHEVVTIPKSVTPSRIKENAQIFDFSLQAEDVEQLDRLNQNRRFGADPDNFNFN